MVARKHSSSYETQLSLYEKLVAANPEITRKGDAYAYTSHNDHMFSILSPSGAMGLRLPKGEREDFLHKFQTQLYESHGTVMKEYVLVPDALLSSTARLGKYLAISLDHIKTLKPKSSKKKTSPFLLHRTALSP